MSNQELYDSYRAKDSTDALKAHRLKTLRDRANRGNKDAQRWLAMINK
jgi:hypothetical protein